MINKIFLKNNEVYKICSKCVNSKLLSDNFYFTVHNNKIKSSSQCKICICAGQALRNKKRAVKQRKQIYNKNYYMNNKSYYKIYWKNHKQNKRINNKVFRIKDALGGKKLNRGARSTGV